MTHGPQTYSPQKHDAPSERLRVLVGLSGGIFSSVTAALLKTQGHEIVGVYLETQVPATLRTAENHCATGNSRANAEKAAASLGIELHVVDVSVLYQARVLDYFVHERALGHSPNPCVPCQREVKLWTLFQKAAELRCDKVATGHGAQVFHDPRNGTYQLLQAGDLGRDQSVFLFTLTQDELSKLLLPLGNFPRNMVSKLGSEYGFEPAISNSQSVCFSDALETAPFVESKLAQALRPSGVIRTVGDQILGEHSGLQKYRLGDPVRVELTADGSEDNVVVGMEEATHALIVGTPENLLKKECVIFRTHWLKKLHQLKGLRCTARLSAEGAPVTCQLTFFENQTAHAEFDQRLGPLFPGQAIVFYLENEVLGGGWIHTTS
jgi:tRNA-specific 2-thiouridylase